MHVAEHLTELAARLADATRARASIALRGRHAPLPPGPPEPAAIQTAQWLARPIQLMERARRRYGETYTMRLLQMPPFVSFSDPDAVRDIFTGPSDQLHAGEANVVLEPIVGASSVLLLDGPAHLRQRRLLLPPFHGERMRAYGAIMRDATLHSMRSWPRGVAFPVHARTQGITLEVILRTVFGLEEGTRRTALRDKLATLLEGVANPWLLLPITRVDLGPRSAGGRLKRLLADVDELLYAQIASVSKGGTAGREDVLSMLVDARDESGGAMTPTELRDELMTLLLAGHETTATSLAWTLHRLLRSPAALARAVREIDDTFGDEVPDPDRVGELEWLDAVVKESLRLQPVVPLVGRRLQSPMRLGGVDLPAGVVAVPNIYLTHRNPRVFEDPERFDPSRFHRQKVSPYAFFPFGGGVRRCIGMAFALYEMKVVLATMLSRVSIEPDPDTRVRLVRRAITFAPSHGMPLVVRDRLAGR